VHWVIPRLANHDVGVIIHSLRAIIDTSFSHPKAWMAPLDTPSHFFVANKIASHFPHLIESGIVLSFHSYFPPGRMTNQYTSSKLFAGAGGGDEDRGILASLGLLIRRLSVAALVVGLLQIIGTFPMYSQEFFMSLVLPVVLAAIITLGTLMLENPVYFVIPAFMIFYFIVSRIYAARRQAMKIADSETIIVNQVDAIGASGGGEGGVIKSDEVRAFQSLKEMEVVQLLPAVSVVTESKQKVQEEVAGAANEGDLNMEDVSDDINRSPSALSDSFAVAAVGDKIVGLAEEDDEIAAVQL
jgi:hypothetical protein